MWQICGAHCVRINAFVEVCVVLHLPPVVMLQLPP